MNRDELPTRPFMLLSVSTLTLAAGLVAWSSRAFSLETSLLLVIMAALAAVSEHFAPVIGSYAVSLGLPLAVCSLLLWGPGAAALVAGASVVSAWAFSSRRAMLVSAFNMGQWVIVTLAAGWVYIQLGGRLLWSASEPQPLTGTDFPGILVPMAACVGVLALGNVAMTSLGVSVLYSRNLRDVMASYASHAPSLAALAAVGFLMAQVTATSVYALLLFIFPLIVARDIYQRFKSLKDAYADTIRSLVGALEAKDLYTRGHSERVAGYAVGIGRAMGHDAKTCETLEYAGLLHDLGKIALPATILTKPGKLTDEEMNLMRNHPAAGAAMVRRIPPLAELENLVRHHHERFEGGGYPEGIAGSEIPALARILTVADAYDAMTTTRSYRPRMSHETACEVVEAAMGTQFDPEVANAFLRNWDDVLGAVATAEEGIPASAETGGIAAAPRAGDA